MALEDTQRQSHTATSISQGIALPLIDNHELEAAAAISRHCVIVFGNRVCCKRGGLEGRITGQASGKGKYESVTMIIDCASVAV